MSSFVINVNKKKVEQALRVAPNKIINSMHDSLTESAIYASNQFKRTLTRHHSIDTGLLRASVSFRFMNRLKVRIAPAQKYAKYVEYGTRPHHVSPEHLEGWAHRHGISPYAVAKSIAKKGTKAHPFVDETFAKVEPYAVHNMNKHIKTTVKEVL